jgi:hypothetical protein
MSGPGWRITLDLYRSTWTWMTHNPQGGSFGSTYCGSKRVALAQALRGLPPGASYTLESLREGRMVRSEARRVGEGA